jgi:hypothetical protein
MSSLENRIARRLPEQQKRPHAAFRFGMLCAIADKMHQEFPAVRKFLLALI